MPRNFDKWLKTFTKTVRTSSYWVDWNKVLKNVQKYKDELNILNGLIGEKDIECEFRRIVNKFPNVIECIPILVAIRSTQVELSSGIIKFNAKQHNIDEVCTFMNESGLFDVLKNKNIKNLIDYLTGVEVGLDSNARKNRTGKIMEDKVEQFLVESKIKYHKEMTSRDVEKEYGINLSPITKSCSIKRFDFVFKVGNIVYGLEVNFYGSGGSKLNETARSYLEIAEQAKKIKNFKFMWITDGCGWETAKNNLRQTFEVLDDMYNINNLKNDLFKKLSNWTKDIYDEIDVLADEDIVLQYKH